MTTPILNINTGGTVARVARELAATPQAIERARTRALQKLFTWVQRQVLRMLSAYTGATQKTFKTLLRFRAYRQSNGGLRIWLGTSPIGAHHLGTVRWTRRMLGARVGRQMYRGTWSWQPPVVTGGLVMFRTGFFNRKRKGRYVGKVREDIQKVMVDIHEEVMRGMDELMPEIGDRFERLFVQELRYALHLERTA